MESINRYYNRISLTVRLFGDLGYSKPTTLMGWLWSERIGFKTAYRVAKSKKMESIKQIKEKYISMDDEYWEHDNSEEYGKGTVNLMLYNIAIQSYNAAISNMLAHGGLKEGHFEDFKRKLKGE